MTAQAVHTPGSPPLAPAAGRERRRCRTAGRRPRVRTSPGDLGTRRQHCQASPQTRGQAVPARTHRCTQPPACGAEDGALGWGACPAELAQVARWQTLPQSPGQADGPGPDPVNGGRETAVPLNPSPAPFFAGNGGQAGFRRPPRTFPGLRPTGLLRAQAIPGSLSPSSSGKSLLGDSQLGLGLCIVFNGLE